MTNKELLPILKELSEFVQFEKIVGSCPDAWEAQINHDNTRFHFGDSPEYCIPTVEWFENRIIKHMRPYRELMICHHRNHGDWLYRTNNMLIRGVVLKEITVGHKNRTVAVASLLLKLFKENKES